MQLHQLKAKYKGAEKKRIGRGGKKGFTSGKGSKGQRARAGRRYKPIIREIIKRYPKLRGYKAQNRPKFIVVINLDRINSVFEKGELVNPKTIVEKKLISFANKSMPVVKILGRGSLKKPLTFENCLFSKSALIKIEKSGSLLKDVAKTDSNR